MGPSRATFNDGLKRLREDFFIWRSRPANRLAVTLVMLTIGLGIPLSRLHIIYRNKSWFATHG